MALSSLRAPSLVSYAVDIAAIAATFAVTLSMVIAGARTAKQMGEDNLLPPWLGKGSKAPAVVVAGVMVASLGLGNVQTIALVANFGIVFSYMLTGVQVAIARRNQGAPGFSSPGYPIVQAFSVVLSAAMLVGLGTQSLLVGTLTLVAGLLAHSIYVHLKAGKGNTPLRGVNGGKEPQGREAEPDSARM